MSDEEVSQWIIYFSPSAWPTAFPHRFESWHIKKWDILWRFCVEIPQSQFIGKKEDEKRIGLYCFSSVSLLCSYWGELPNLLSLCFLYSKWCSAQAAWKRYKVVTSWSLKRVLELFLCSVLPEKTTSSKPKEYSHISFHLSSMQAARYNTYLYCKNFLCQQKTLWRASSVPEIKFIAWSCNVCASSAAIIVNGNKLVACLMAQEKKFESAADNANLLPIYGL